VYTDAIDVLSLVNNYFLVVTSLLACLFKLTVTLHRNHVAIKHNLVIEATVGHFGRVWSKIDRCSVAEQSACQRLQRPTGHTQASVIMCAMPLVKPVLFCLCSLLALCVPSNITSVL